jgi:hypothetical protein
LPTSIRINRRFCPAGRFPAPEDEIEAMLARDAAEGGCGCAGGYTDVTRPK